MKRLNENQLGSVGKFGEDAAAEYLAANGYEIITRNIKYDKTEIDIVASDEFRIVFFEVKTRTVRPEPGAGRYGSPSSSIDRAKKQHTVSAVRSYLREYPPDKPPRIDVLEVYVEHTDSGYSVRNINHFRNAFGITK